MNENELTNEQLAISARCFQLLLGVHNFMPLASSPGREVITEMCRNYCKEFDLKFIENYKLKYGNGFGYIGFMVSGDNENICLGIKDGKVVISKI